MHVSWMMVQAQGALNIEMLMLGCCFPPIKICSYAPVVRGR